MKTEFSPFVSPSTKAFEFTPLPVIMGVVLGIIFGASSLYLALKIGLTVSASIPIAVLSITVFRGISKAFGLRKASILENNIVQTAGSAGESLAFGVAVTMPALLILGHEMDVWRSTLVALLGGLIGVLFMIPLRQSLIVEEHGKLKYPEGTACAEILISGEKGGTSAQTVFSGFILGLVYKMISVGMHMWKDVVERPLNWFKGAALGAELSPELLGVGFIIGPRTGCVMLSGGIFSACLLTPMALLFGQNAVAPIFPGKKLVAMMSTHEIWRSYVLYIGAGAVATAGIISLVRALPLIVRSARAGLGQLKTARGAKSGAAFDRTTQDISLKYVGIGILVLVAVIWAVPAFHMNFLGSIMILLFGFLFVTVSSRLTGEIGSSSNPISGMTVATLLLTCLIFLAMGWVGEAERITALSVAAIVCIAASNGGTISQDLKTGYLVGASPLKQQFAMLAGTVSSALIIGFTLQLLNQASTVYTQKNLPTITIPGSILASLNDQESATGSTEKMKVLRIPENPAPDTPLLPLIGQISAGKYLVDAEGKIRYLVDPGINGNLNQRDDGTPVQKYEAPKARLMSLIIDGILTRKLPWELVLLGAAIAIAIELLGISALPFAVGVYLPLSASAGVFLGGMVRAIVEWLARRQKRKDDVSSDSGPGVLFASGLIAGGSIAGIGIAGISLNEPIRHALDWGSKWPLLADSDLFAVVCFTLMVGAFFKAALSHQKA